MPKYDKSLIAKAFKISSNKNTKCTSIIATNTYDIRIDNSVIMHVVQWDLPMSFKSRIQCMSCVEKKRRQATFVLLI